MANLERMKRELEALRDMSEPCEGGTTRFTYTPSYRQAADYVMARMEEAGLTVREDAVGNIFGLRRGKNPDAPKIISGSHLDTVRCGGYFDGQAGIICALEAARMMNENGDELEGDFEVAAMVMEEGARFKNLGGSKFVMGVNTEQDLDNQTDDDGITLRQAIRAYGLSGELDGVCRRDENVKAFLEVHIEQNARMERAGKKIGIVDTIWGCRWFSLTVNGVTDHASTPMDERQDAMLAAAKLISRMGDLVTGEYTGKAALTVGRMNVFPDQINAIASRVQFTMDFRSGYETYFDALDASLAAFIRQVEEEYRVKVDLELYSYTPPILNDEKIRAAMEASAEELGLGSMHLDSGAGHDAMVFGMYWPTSMMFLPSHLGLTHCPDEWTDYEDVARGADALYHTVRKLDAN